LIEFLLDILKLFKKGTPAGYQEGYLLGKAFRANST
jgi:hypothetical protein